MAAELAEPNYLLKIVPHVDCKPRICELVRYGFEEVKLKDRGVERVSHLVREVQRQGSHGAQRFGIRGALLE